MKSTWTKDEQTTIHNSNNSIMLYNLISVTKSFNFSFEIQSWLHDWTYQIVAKCLEFIGLIFSAIGLKSFWQNEYCLSRFFTNIFASEKHTTTERGTEKSCGIVYKVIIRPLKRPQLMELFVRNKIICSFCHLSLFKW